MTTMVMWIGAAFGLRAQQPAPPAAAVVAATRSANDRATVTMTGGKAMVSISSPRGIGSATLDRKGERWPAVSLRLNLRGLESLKITAGRAVFGAAVSSLKEGGQRLTLSTPGKSEEPVNSSSVYWTTIRAFDEGGQTIAGLPPAGGWFELEVPAALLEGAQSVSVEWIDFYR
jgi:hypothetical protein